jgi:penicillin V acylase-like amidase (Ntn superfamily)
MNRNYPVSLLLLSFFLMSFHQLATACSMYKVTTGDNTLVGCNEDAWRTNSKIWFVNARNAEEFGAGFTGSRQVSANGFAPQSGMNEAGLVFSRLASYHPRQALPSDDRKRITNEVTYLTDILLQCATVEEVKLFVEQYDHSIFIDDVFIYIDRSGKYLVVEPYNLILGDDPYYVLSNFCPSITEPENARELDRYRKGVDFLEAHAIEASLSFCTAVSDTMHVCRDRNGDGTLLTSIWNTKQRVGEPFLLPRFR